MGTKNLNLTKVIRNRNTLQSHIKPQSNRYNAHDCGGEVGSYGGKEGVANFFNADTAKVHRDCIKGGFT